MRGFQMFSWLAVALMIVIGTGCDETGPVGVDLEAQQTSDAVSLAKSTVKYVPFAGSWTTWFDDTVDLGVVCDGLFLFQASAEGNATHLGHATVVSNHCLDFSTGVMSNGYAVTTAANGDQLFWSYNGWADLLSNPGPFWVELELIGGTGRFENATSMSARHEGTTLDGISTYTTTGWISTIGSSK